MNENKLTKLGKGVFQFGPIEKPDEKQTLRILVHSYSGSCCYENNKRYVESRDDIITNEDNPIVMLAGKRDLFPLVERYENKPFTDYRMIILTKDYDPDPMTMSWEEMKKLIRVEFNPKKILVSGAELKTDKRGEPFGGCVYDAYSNLKELKPQIDLKNCYKVDWRCNPIIFLS